MTRSTSHKIFYMAHYIWSINRTTHVFFFYKLCFEVFPFHLFITCCTWEYWWSCHLVQSLVLLINSNALPTLLITWSVVRDDFLLPSLSYYFPWVFWLLSRPLPSVVSWYIQEALTTLFLFTINYFSLFSNISKDIFTCSFVCSNYLLHLLPQSHLFF